MRNLIVKQVPSPIAVSTKILPPWASTISLLGELQRPKPHMHMLRHFDTDVVAIQGLPNRAAEPVDAGSASPPSISAIPSVARLP